MSRNQYFGFLSAMAGVAALAACGTAATSSPSATLLTTASPTVSAGAATRPAVPSPSTASTSSSLTFSGNHSGTLTGVNVLCGNSIKGSTNPSGQYIEATGTLSGKSFDVVVLSPAGVVASQAAIMVSTGSGNEAPSGVWTTPPQSTTGESGFDVTSGVNLNGDLAPQATFANPDEATSTLHVSGRIACA